MCISLSTGSLGLISPPNMYARPAMTLRECEERGRGGALTRSHFALMGWVDWKRPRTAAAAVAAVSIILADLMWIVLRCVWW